MTSKLPGMFLPKEPRLRMLVRMLVAAAVVAALALWAGASATYY